jgi:hypothetical protein
MNSPSQFRPEPPPALTSTEWADDYNRTKTLGAINSTVRTPAQTEIGLFWTDHSGKQYARAFRALATAQGLDRLPRLAPLQAEEIVSDSRI